MPTHVFLRKTRYYYSAHITDTEWEELFVEFADAPPHHGRVIVCSALTGAVLWTSTGIHRRDARTARIAAETYTDSRRRSDQHSPQ